MRQFLSILLSLTAAPAMASVPCGGSFGGFVDQMKAAAIEQGHSADTVNTFFSSVRQDPKVIRSDRAQGVFKMAFIDFSRRIISQNRLDRGRANARTYASVFDRAEADYGVPPGVLLAFWALETDYGAVQGEFNTLNALMTLSHDCRRPELFRPQVFAALELFKTGDFSPARTKGAWAGEIGMVQMLPEDIIKNGVDADGDGQVSLKTSAPDALLSGAKMLKGLGWRAGEPWLQEVTVPSDLDWSQTGLTTRKSVAEWADLGVAARQGDLGPATLEAAVLLPQGRKGPAFLAYPNFDVYFEWNQSFVYVTTAAYFATRLSGATVYNAGSPDAGLSDGQMRALQQKLQDRGYDVGKIDGILGARTRAAVQAEQQRLGLPADAWPTRQLLDKL
ncbi:lytic murein transglycosylase [Actibacterium sp. 188UL27-1]|uniref:lytic murein transglycosylase n=1 Tax=Actibacterium sp. 188UL27-1 TaxID=2786961 RepID=UPI00195EC22B|nr:lytic murein transglycosylase [Actibacterium sp. 188UL27-1]MBM7068632.1 lytic murein transglycosylase [Actibacterium sp. 188UL27-1]